MFKIIAKVLANRLKMVLRNIFYESQNDFVIVVDFLKNGEDGFSSAFILLNSPFSIMELRVVSLKVLEV